MIEKTIKISAPGSAMLLGEHAVLYGYPAVVCALNQYMTVSLTPRVDREIHIKSDRMGNYRSDLEQLQEDRAFRFVLSAIQHFQEQLVYGFDLKIESDFSEKIGFGSSAAVTVATVGAITYLLTEKLDLDFIHQTSVSVIRDVQGLGSGGDVLASVYGGVLAYRSDSLVYEKLADSLPIHLIYSGYKTPTVEVVQKVREKASQFPKLFAKLFLAMGECVEAGKKSILNGDLTRLGKVFLIHQSLQDAIGVNDAVLSDIMREVSCLEGVFGAKISGAGLGDCVMVLGEMPTRYFPLNEAQKEAGVLQIPVKVSKKGIFIH